MKTISTFVIAALAIAGLGASGSADIESAMASEAAYCARLNSGVHSDYKNLREVCDDRH